MLLYFYEKNMTQGTTSFLFLPGAGKGTQAAKIVEKFGDDRKTKINKLVAFNV